MILVGWAVLGVVAGAVGSEVLRARQPKLIERVEGAAKRFVDRLCPCKPTDQEEEGSLAEDGSRQEDGGDAQGEDE